MDVFEVSSFQALKCALPPKPLEPAKGKGRKSKPELEQASQQPHQENQWVPVA